MTTKPNKIEIVRLIIANKLSTVTRTQTGILYWDDNLVELIYV